MERRTFHFKEIETLDWYDGIVRGIGADEQGYFFIILVAWKIPESEKLYAVLGINQDTEKSIRISFDPNRSKEVNWKVFNRAFDEMIKNHEDPVFLVQGDLLAGNLYKAKMLDESNSLDRIVPYDIHRVFQSDSIAFWFSQT
jgi:hypothetical protein